ncbi:MAG TPA: polysaccharide biosynthesis/export family protein [Vicinamibacterales bacterium]|nr:polysaccharide biosynthesis/export family protein [Vicinamibacterales bacterium]
MPDALLLLVALVAGQAGAATQPVTPAPSQSQVVSSYVVGPADVLGIKVFGEDALSNKYTVDTDGSITFPLLGRVEVSRKTTRQIEEELTKMLAGDFLRRPQVSVEVAQYRSRSIFVIGEVRSPARYTIEGPMTLLEVIAEAGSTTPAASDTIIVQRYKEGMAAAVTAPAMPDDDRSVEVLRVSLEDLRAGRLAANILLQENDTIIVPPAPLVYVSGYVKQPGSFPIRPGMTVRQAITEAGGVSERGSTRGIKIVRKDKTGKEVEIDADMSTLVQPNDTIKIRARLI